MATTGIAECQSDPRAGDKTRVGVTTQMVRAEPVVPRRSLQAARDVLRVRVVRRQRAREQCPRDEQRQEREAQDRARLPQRMAVVPLSRLHGFLDSHPWVDEAVGQVDDEVGGDEQRGDDEHHALHDGEVALGDRVATAPYRLPCE